MPDRADAVLDLEPDELTTGPPELDAPADRFADPTDAGRSAQWPGEPEHLALEQPRRDRACVAGLPPEPRRHLAPRGHQLRRLLPRGHGGLGVPVRRRRPRGPAPADRAHPRGLARRGARGAGRPALRLPRRRPVAPRERPALQPGQAAPRPLRPGDQRPGQRSRRAAAARRRRPGSCRARSTRLRRCRAAWWSTTTSTGATTGRCGTGGATPSSTSCTSRGSPRCTTRCPSTCAAPTPVSAPRR